MTSEQSNILKKWFEDYVSGFFQNDPDVNRAIQLKKDHTYRVCRNIQTLCESISLCPNDVRIADITALYHDIGRFPQFARYRTFNDHISCNHARLGVKVLGINRVLHMLSLNERRLISKSIAFHNAVRIPNCLEPRQDIFIRLLRDADKLDIWQVMIDHFSQYRENPKNAVFLNLSDRPECSAKILKAIFDGSFARTQDMATLNDFKLLQISWVFDLNFTATFKIVKERRFIEKLAEGLPPDREVTMAINNALDQVEHCSSVKKSKLRSA